MAGTIFDALIFYELFPFSILFSLFDPEASASESEDDNERNDAAEEETNDVEEFDGEFVNLEEANRISCARKKRRRHSSDYATNTIEENDDNDVEYHSKELESEPESDEEGNVIEKEKFPPFVPQSSMAIKMGCWFII